MAASFSVQNVGETTANIFVTPDSGYKYYRVFVRETYGSQTTVFDQWYSNISYSFSAYVSGLSAGTSYTVNVSYATTQSAAAATWIGAQSFTTSASATTGTWKLRIYAPTNGIEAVDIAYLDNVTGGYEVVASGLEPKGDSVACYTDLAVSVNSTAMIVISTSSASINVSGWVINVNGSATRVDPYTDETMKNVLATGPWTAGDDVSIRVEMPTTGTYSVTVVYDANGGTGAPGSQTVTGTSQYLSLTLSSVKPTRSGYTFLGWATSPTATTATYSPSQYLSSVYATTAGNYWYLYAVWLAVTDGVARIWYNGAWKQTPAYVWYNGAWKKSTVYVYYNGWKKGT